jgi:hypothetical protein
LCEMPLTLGVDSRVPPSPSSKVSPLHFMFYLGGVLITTCFNRGACPRVPSHTVKLGLKELLERCVA